MKQELVDYFIAETNKKFDLLARDIKDVKRDVDKLVAFRFMILGASALVSGLAAILIEIFLK